MEFPSFHSESVQNRLSFTNASVADWLRSQRACMAHGYFFGVQDRSMARRNVDELQKGEPDPDDLVAAFGANLKAARLKQGLTQAQLAERAGLLQQYVSLIESGKQNVTLTTAQTLARVVHQNVSEMLRGTAPSGRRK
jgi:DNA-binding XRE family transcriptional regulator